jgi:hypothetical protein
MLEFDRRDGESVQGYADRLQALDAARLSATNRLLLRSRLDAARAHADVAARQELARQQLERAKQLDAARQAQPIPSPLELAKMVVEQLDDADRARLVEWLARREK